MKRHIPNMITCCNLISGCIATTFALYGNPTMALLWIVAGAVFDFFDGMSARLLGVSSPIGKELDSLADDITFGLAPSAMLFFQLGVMDYPGALESLRAYLPYCAFIMAAFSALRLAKFNLDERQTTSFIGLPTPANALFWASLMAGGSGLIDGSRFMPLALLALMAVSCWMLVAEIPMFALKFKQWGWRGNEVRYGFILSSVVLLALFRLPGIAVVIAWYVALSVMVNLRSAR